MSNLVSHVLRVSFIPMISKRMTFWSLRGWTNQVTFGHETLFVHTASILIGHFIRLTHPCVERNNASLWTNDSWQSFRPVWSNIYSFLCNEMSLIFAFQSSGNKTDYQPVKISGKFVIPEMYKFDCLLLTNIKSHKNGAQCISFKSHGKGHFRH